MPSSISNSNTNEIFHRQIPSMGWLRIALTASFIIILITGCWEYYVRRLGYVPTLNDTPYLWSTIREKVNTLPEDGTIITGSSRALFDLRLDILKNLTGHEPIQLSIVGSSPKPVLQNIIENTNFKGTIIVGVTPVLFFAPGGPPMNKPYDWIKFSRKFSFSQRIGQWLGAFLQHKLAFIQQEDLTLNALLENINIPNRPNAKLPPRFPPFLNLMDTNRQASLIDMVSNNSELQNVVKSRWQGLFGAVPQAPQEAIDLVIDEYVEITKEMERRGGKIIFIRPPSTGWLLEKEEALTPRANTWDQLLKRSGAPGIHFQDFTNQQFNCPEWSHISENDSYLYTNSLMPLLKDMIK